MNAKLTLIEIEYYCYYLNNIRLYLRDLVNYIKRSDTWKIQLTIIDFISSKDDNDEDGVIHSKSDNRSYE